MMFGVFRRLFENPASCGRPVGRTKKNPRRRCVGLNGEVLERRNLLATLVAADFGWAMDIGLTSDSMSHHVAADSQGNVYVAGEFFGTLDFDPGPESRTLTSATGDGTSFSSPDVFLAKFTSAGQLLWLRQFGDTGADHVRGLCVDASDNLTLVGDFHGQVDFDPGTGVKLLTADANYTNVFVVQLTASGDFKWARQFEGVGNDTATAVAVDPFGNLVVSGTFYSTCDFDPGPGSAILDVTTGTKGKAFVASLSIAGDFRWVKQYSGTPSSLAADADGNVIIAGSFYSSMSLDPSDSGRKLLSSNYSEAAYVIQLSTAGQLNWARQFGGVSGSGYSASATALAVAVDAQRNVLLGGYFKGTSGFDSGVSTTTLSSAGNTDAFVMKWTAAGSLLWASRFGSVGYDRLSTIAVTSGNQLVVAGEFEFTVDFDINDGIQARTSEGGADSFVLGLASDGRYRWVKQFGGLNAAAYTTSTAVRLGQDVLLAGDYVNDVYATETSTRLLHPRGAGDSTSINGGGSGGDRPSSSGYWGGFGMLIHDTVTSSTTPPSVPTNVSVVAGNGQVTLSWTAPSDNGGSAVTDYTIQYSSTGGTTWTTYADSVSASTTSTVTGLTNGVSYLFRVAAMNGVGAGPYSASSAGVTPMAAAVGRLVAIAGDGILVVRWVAPRLVRMPAITGYVIRYSSDNGVSWNLYSDTGSPVTSRSVVLANGNTYVLQVAPVLAGGVGRYSASSLPVTPYSPFSKPEAPSSVVAVSTGESVVLYWNAIAGNAGGFVKDYVIQYRANTPNARWVTYRDTTSSVPAATLRLRNGNSYVFRVAAKNLAGVGAFSSPSSPVMA